MSVPFFSRDSRSLPKIGAGVPLAWNLLALSLAGLPVHAETAAATAAPSAPAVTLSTAQAAAVRYDFGPVGMAAGNTLRRTYTLKNTGTAPLTVQGVTTSCGCTQAVLEGHNLSGRGPTVTGDPVTLPPGQSARLAIIVNVSELHPGPIRKTITVSGASDAAPLAIIDLFATLVPAIAFSPQTVDFGPATAGAEHTATLTATVDSRLLSSGKAPELRSSDPSVRITLLPPPARHAGQAVPLAYRLTLAPDTPIGSLAGRLYFAPPPRASADDGQSLWTVGAGVTAQVVGDISASDSQLSPGIVPAATGTTTRITLTGKNASALTDLSCTSDDPGVTARLLPADPASPTATLEVTVAPHHAPGVLQTQITLRTHSGQRLLLPLVATVQ